MKTEDVTLGFVNKSVTKENKDLEKLFNKENIGVYGPFETDLGLALYRIREISAENQISFFDAKSDIRTVLASEIAKNETFKLICLLSNAHWLFLKLLYPRIY